MVLHKFNIYPEKYHYYKVLIFDTKKAMHRYWKRYGSDYVTSNFEGICHSYEIRKYKNNKPKKIIKPDIGFILLYKDMIGSGIVSHEITHATTYWCRRVNFTLNTSKINKDSDERYAYALGNMVNQFWNKYYAKTKPTS